MRKYVLMEKKTRCEKMREVFQMPKDVKARGCEKMSRCETVWHVQDVRRCQL